MRDSDGTSVDSKRAKAKRAVVTIDGNEAAASVAHRLSEVIVIYPITPSSTMGELSEEWSAKGNRNIWGEVPDVVQMQSEAGAIGAVHGALQAGALATTFTASQGLLLMIPSLYKIAGELTPIAIHVAARAIATSALSIFGDHSDVMAVRQTGVALLSSASVQEAHDFAAVAHLATLQCRVPFIHFFDGFRTSHELNQCELLSDDELRQLVDDDKVRFCRDHAMNPDRPVLRGTAQNPDTYFQQREAVNPFYLDTPGAVRDAFAKIAKLTGRRYDLVEYDGPADAERVVVIMGSGSRAAQAAARKLCEAGEKVGVVTVRLYRPFDVESFIRVLPASVKRIAVLDRCKEPGAIGEPLYLDVVAALSRAGRIVSGGVVGGRYGLSSKEFTPAMARAVFDELKRPSPRHGFTVGILDDVTKLSLDVPDPDWAAETEGVVTALFYGLGADGTVGANKNSIKILSGESGLSAQGYFVYDSKKSGAMTVSHLRFGPSAIDTPWLVRKADFVACHHAPFLGKVDVLEFAKDGGTLLLNMSAAREDVWESLPESVQAAVSRRKLKLFAIDAERVSDEAGLGRRINTVMQTCFFALSGVLPREQAIDAIKESIRKTYARKGPKVVESNCAAVDATLAGLHEIPVPGYDARLDIELKPAEVVPAGAPDFVKKVTSLLLAGKGEMLPVSAFPPDGTYPTATSRWEKRSIATEIPVWDEKACIQCGKCAFVCPHAAIRTKAYSPDALGGAPASFKSADYKAGDFKGKKFTLQVSPDDCTGCTLCYAVCPVKDKADPSIRALAMVAKGEVEAGERASYGFFETLPDVPREKVTRLDVKGTQLLKPLFEFSGACTGCGQTPYIKLLTQLYGDRLLIANATGCSSIYGGNLPTTPYTTDENGRGPAWCNSLFEDNAEFGFGLRLSQDHLQRYARSLLKTQAATLGEELVSALLAECTGEAALARRREQIVLLRQRLASATSLEARTLVQLADHLAPKSVWLIGGDGWAYDIGYGGLDHVISTGRKVNILVLDSEVYSNTGGQASKSTPLAASAKFATNGKGQSKKDLGLMAMCYGGVYVASVAFGENDAHTVKVLQEAESYDGPSLVIAYSHCIAHGYDLADGLTQQQKAVKSGMWPLYRFDPRLKASGKSPLQIDSKPPTLTVEEYMASQGRFAAIARSDPERHAMLHAEAQVRVRERLELYQKLAVAWVPPVPVSTPASEAAPTPSAAARA